MSKAAGGEGPERGADLHYDSWLIPSSRALWQLSKRLFLEVEVATPRPERVRQDAATRRQDMVANLVANLALLTAYRPEGSPLIISTRRPKHSRYMRHQFPPKTFMAVVGTLEHLGYLDRVAGTYNGLRTTLRPTERLRHHLPGLGGSVALGRLEGAESIYIKAPVPRAKVKVLVNYQDTEETHRLRGEMDAINSAINAASITLDGQRQPPVHLIRQFHIPSSTSPPKFDGHGRLYWGVFWQSLKRDRRSSLRIDGHPVAELDYSGMFARLAYAEAGMAPPDGDLYEGLDMSRLAAKTAVSALLCREGPMVRLPDDLKAELGEGWSGSRVTAAVAAKHPHIAPLFGQGIWPRLMFTESQIMVSVLLGLLARGIVALPIHDGLLVAETHAEVCTQIMGEMAERATGFRFPVVTK